MDLTLVITTYNRATALRQMLDHLNQQSDTAFQVVVAIDGSTDNTVKMLEKLHTVYDMKWVNTYSRGYGLAVARNLGILAADGEAVAILDDDSLPCPDLVAAHKQSVCRGTITGGPRNPSDAADKRLAWKMEQLSFLPSCTPIPIERMRQDWPNAYLVENNICLYRRDWIDFGLFSEQLKMYGFIGQEFFARAEYFGYSYQFNPKAAIVHQSHLEGDNGLHQSRKRRQIRIAEAIRPSLMTPKYFEAQVRWAQGQAASPVKDYDLPPFRLRAGLLFPYRYSRCLLNNLKRKLIRNFA